MTWQALYDNPAHRVKSWVTTLLASRAPLERAAGGQLGQVLGCGHWGCVVDLVDTPYVLKLTVDPTEAHIWAKLVELIEDERYGGDGFPRIKKIFKLEPGIPYGNRGRSRTAFGIVREKVAPVFNTSGWSAVTTSFTAQVLDVQEALGAGTTMDTLAVHAKRAQNYKLNDFLETIEALHRYRQAASSYHGETRGGFRTTSPDIALRQAEVATSRMTGAIGGPLGESLSMLASNEVLLRDVHLGNIGWRFLPEVEGEEGYTCLVVFDPGHTPTAKRMLPAEQWVQLAQLC